MKTSVLIVFVFILSASITLKAQDGGIKKVELSGVVTDYDNNPIKGVRVFVDSLKTTVKTDKNGFYKIILTNKNKLITAYSLKHGLIDIGYNGEDKINFIFPKEKEIITKKKFSELGYGLSNYDDKSIDYSSYTDIFQLLRTKFQNVEIIGSEIRIKGSGSSLSSANANIPPIFIVNNSQVSSISSINPADIKSVSVNRANTSLYGSRGAGGVIKIVLK